MVLLDAALQLDAWGWQPGAGRDPAPGSLALLGELVQAWIDTGALCPWWDRRRRGVNRQTLEVR
jgi:hypothetical protein